jgi:hypothetical protein
MIVLGLLLILVAVGATVFALTAPSAAAQTIEVTALGFTVSASPMAMFFAGAVSLALLALGYVLINGGTRRKARSRKELHQLRKEQAAAGASTSAAAGERSRRSDRREKGGSTDSSTDSSTGSDTTTGTSTGSDTTTGTSTGSDTTTGTSTGNGAESSKDLPPERQTNS